jgi:hypothetical protein
VPTTKSREKVGALHNTYLRRDGKLNTETGSPICQSVSHALQSEICDHD